MAKQFTMVMLPDRQGSKITVSEQAIVALPAADEIILARGDLVHPARQLEIMNGWKWLWHGVRDRNLLDVQFLGAILVTSVSIESITEEDRRTSSNLDTTLDTDITLMMGSGVTGAGRAGATQIFDSAFRMIREFARENGLETPP